MVSTLETGALKGAALTGWVRRDALLTAGSCDILGDKR
jgi:hypothetical protein